MNSIRYIFTILLIVCSSFVHADSYKIIEHFQPAEAGMDIYSLAEKKSLDTYTYYWEQLTKWSAKKLNRIIASYPLISGQFCHAQVCNIFVSDFSLQALELVHQGETQPIRDRLHPNIIRTKLTAERYHILHKIVEEYYLNLRNSISINTKQIRKFSNIGVFLDGDITNSSYDLTYDIEKLNSIIYRNPTEYEGIENTVSQDALQAFDIPGNTSNFNLPSTSGTSPHNESSSHVSTNQWDDEVHSCPIITENRKIVDTINNQRHREQRITDAFANNISASEEIFFPGSSPLDNFSFSGWLAQAHNPYICENDIVCITIEFLGPKGVNEIFSSKAKNSTTEGIISTHLYHAEKQIQKSMLASDMTANYFELGFKDLSFADRLSLFVDIQYLPAQLGSPKKRDNSSPTTVGSNPYILTHTFKKQGLDYENQNNLLPLIDQLKERILVEYSENLPPEEIEKKINKELKREENEQKKSEHFIRAMEAEFESEHYKEWLANIAEIQSFTKAFQLQTEEIATTIRLLSKKR